MGALFCLPIYHIEEVSHTIWQEREKVALQEIENKAKMISIHRLDDYLCQNSKASTKTVLDIICEFSNIPLQKAHIQESTVFLYTRYEQLDIENFKENFQ